jgi:hypothetical protein
MASGIVNKHEPWHAILNHTFAYGNIAVYKYGILLTEYSCFIKYYQIGIIDQNVLSEMSFIDWKKEYIYETPIGAKAETLVDPDTKTCSYDVSFIGRNGFCKFVSILEFDGADTWRRCTGYSLEITCKLCT